MTQSEFLEELTGCASMVRWHLWGEEKKIRALDNVTLALHCPISWVAYCKKCDVADIDLPFTSAGCLDLQSWDAADIIMAADGEEDEVALRGLLLKAVKLI